MGEVLAALREEHPSRAVVIRLQEGQERLLGARVFAQCWMPFGHRRQICCEQIEISASDASLPDLPAVVLPLRVPDLPVIVWCRSARAFQLPAFLPLAGIGNRVLVDTARHPSPQDALAEIRAAVKAGVAVADLSWTRLTRWRELVSQIFESPARLSRLAGSEAVVEYGGDVEPVTARYFASWLAEGLERIRMRPVPEATGGITGLTISDAGGVISIRLGAGEVAEVRLDGIVSRAAFPKASAYSLLREELGITARDRVYERTLARVQ